MGQVIPDGNLSFRGGQNAGILADRIREDQYASGINLTTIDGGIGPRPGLVYQDLEMLSEGGVQNRSGNVVPYSEILRSGKFQGAHSYITDGFRGIIAVISGVIFAIDPIDRTAQAIDIEAQQSNTETFEPATQRINQYARRVHIAEAGRFLVIHDWPDTPIIIEGMTARRSDPNAVDEAGNPAPELFASVLGAYNQNRYFLTSAANDFTAGDPVGNTVTPDAPITTLELTTQAAPFVGQVFSLGSSNKNKPITAIGFLQVTDNSTEVGPLFLATKDSIYTFRTDLPRTQWEQTKFSRILLFNAGIVGPRAFVNLNTDLIFMGGDGRIRSLAISAQEQRKFANTPIDREVSNWVVADDPELLELTSIEYANNRVFITVDPYRTDAQDLNRQAVTDYAFEGVVVMELDNVSGMLSDAAPVWAGLWTGVNPMELVNFDGNLYVFAKDPGGINSLYRLDESSSFDVYQDTIRPITTRMYSREYPFQDRFALKEEHTVELSMANVEGALTLKVERKIDCASRWSLWREVKHEATVRECGPVDCEEERETLQGRSFRDINLGSPVETTCDTVNGDHRYFNLCQYRVTITAENYKLRAFRPIATLQEDASRIFISCNNKKEKVVKHCEVADHYIHSTPFTSEEVCL